MTNRRDEFTVEFFVFVRFKLEAIVRAQASAGGQGGRRAARTGAEGDDDDEAVEAKEQEKLVGEGGEVEGERVVALGTSAGGGVGVSGGGIDDGNDDDNDGIARAEGAERKAGLRP